MKCIKVLLYNFLKQIVDEEYNCELKHLKKDLESTKILLNTFMWRLRLEEARERIYVKELGKRLERVSAAGDIDETQPPCTYFEQLKWVKE